MSSVQRKEKHNIMYTGIETHTLGHPGASAVKNPPPMSGMQIRSLGWEDPLEEEKAPTPVFLPGDSHGQRSLAG